MSRLLVLALIVFSGSVLTMGEEDCYYWQEGPGGGVQYGECYPNPPQPTDVYCTGLCSINLMTNKLECDGPQTQHEYDTSSEWELHDANVEDGYREAISWDLYCHETADCKCTEPMFEGEESDCVTDLGSHDEGDPTEVRELDTNSPCPEE